MIHYILQTIAFQLLFLVVYDLFLRRETFFNYNRLYLLLTPLVSFLLPFIQIAALRERIPPAYIIELPAVIIGSTTETSVAVESTLLTWTNLWILGALISAAFLGYKFFKIIKLKRKAAAVSVQNYQIRILPETNAAFTFFQTIYLGDQLSEAQKENILLHEQVHVKQYHTLDLLFFEVLRLLFWFNPLLYLFQKRTASLHEYIADSYVTKQQTPSDYYQNLLSEVFQTEKVSFINTFFNHSLIKNRIVMLQKSKSKKIVQLKYLLLVPVLGMMLFYTSCTQDVNAQQGQNYIESASENNSEVLRKIAELKESIAKKGNITQEEEDALKVLYVLTNPKGLEIDVFQEVKDKVHIPFGVIEKVPVFPGCEGMSKEEAKKCFSKKMTAFVFEGFNTKVAKSDVTGKQRILVKFKIDNSGNIKDVMAKSEHKELRDEAIRVVNTLPKMIPGEHQGKKVGVQYSLPILFEIK